MEFYTPNEISAFYHACIARGQRQMLSDAVAARVSQADTKDWKAFHHEAEQAAKKLLEPFNGKPKPKPRKDDNALKAFFGKLASIKGKQR